ncbi:MAG: Na(+)/H(+) antiporter subunit B [Alphaproteobacteria bacterium]
MEHYAVLRVIAKLLMPPIFLFALYVQFHGDYGPGGGFQAGVIFGAGFILYALVFGLARARRVFPGPALRIALATGVLIFAGVGVANLALGGNYLDYSTLAHEAKEGQHLGILLVELGVGIAVAAAMMTIFTHFAEHERAGSGKGDE